MYAKKDLLDDLKKTIDVLEKDEFDVSVDLCLLVLERILFNWKRWQRSLVKDLYEKSL